MFTGIVSAVGRVAAASRKGDTVELTIEAPYVDLAEGESIAVAGACLTVVEAAPGRFRVQAVAATQGRTRLGSLRAGERVNLERSLKASDRLGGHFVQGHVDGLAEVVAVDDHNDMRLLDLRVPAAVAEVAVLQGSIAVDGVSLTINALPKPGVVQISLIPYTREHTTLGDLAVGDRVHLEGDVIGKHVRRQLEQRGA